MEPTNRQNSSVTDVSPRIPSLKRSHSDMRESQTPRKWVDEDVYLNTVLRIPADTTEDEIDAKLNEQATILGLRSEVNSIDVQGITSSMSATTVASDPATVQSSIMSQSTAPTSCSSSEHRPVTSSTHKSDPALATRSLPIAMQETDKKRRNTGFRNGIRKMTGFRKKKSSTPTSPSLSTISSTIDTRSNNDALSLNSGLKSPSLISHQDSLWSHKVPPTKHSYDQDTLVDHEALRRTMECKEMISLRATQLEERQRFLDYQSALVLQIRKERDATKAKKTEVHQAVLPIQREKNERAIEELELRQLEEELRVVKEHEIEKRTILIRLRHMEAYCQTPSPPPTPLDLGFTPLPSTAAADPTTPPSADASSEFLQCVPLPERKITDKDYHNLAQQYRERDAMDNLHNSKINVLRGKQKRAVENFIAKKEREIRDTEAEQKKELQSIDWSFAKQEAELRAELGAKRERLEMRWKLQARIERTKMERRSGLKFESLPDVIATENEKVLSSGSPANLDSMLKIHSPIIRPMTSVGVPASTGLGMMHLPPKRKSSLLFA